MDDKAISCDHIALFTNNLEDLALFYTKHFGFIKENEQILPRNLAEVIFGMKENCRFLKLELGNFKLEIFQPVSGSVEEIAALPAGLNHWGCHVRDRKEFAHKLKDAGVEVIEIKRNSHMVYFAKDPDGNLIELRDG